MVEGTNRNTSPWNYSKIAVFGATKTLAKARGPTLSVKACKDADTATCLPHLLPLHSPFYFRLSSSFQRQQNHSHWHWLGMLTAKRACSATPAANLRLKLLRHLGLGLNLNYYFDLGFPLPFNTKLYSVTCGKPLEVKGLSGAKRPRRPRIG